MNNADFRQNDLIDMKLHMACDKLTDAEQSQAAACSGPDSEEHARAKSHKLRPSAMQMSNWVKGGSHLDDSHRA